MRSLPPALLLALLALAAPRARAQSYVEMLDDATLYAAPSVYATAVATIPEDGVAELLQCATSWCEVRAGGTRGYVRQRMVKATDRRPPPLPSPPAPQVAAPSVPASLPLPNPAPQRTPRPERPEQPVAARPPVQETAPARTVAPVRPPSPPPPSPPPQPAQAPPPIPAAVSYKNPTAGTLLSAFLPGTGHFYAGEPKAGTVLLLVSLSAPAAGYLLSDRTADATCVPSPADDRARCRDTTDYGPLFVGVGIAATAWVAGLLDAGAAVRRANERLRASNVHVSPVTDAGHAGLALRVTF